MVGMLIAVIQVEEMYMLKVKLEDLEIESSNCVLNHTIAIPENQSTCELISKWLPIQQSNKLVVSWNCKTDVSNHLELFAKVKDEKKNISNWLSYGQWSKDESGSVDGQCHEMFGIDVDEIYSEDKIQYIKIKVILSRKYSEAKSPELVGLYIAEKRAFQESIIEVPNIDLEVPEMSQMLIHDIGSVACSPTSLAMVLNYYGQDLQVLDVAKGCYDVAADIYGNWAYNVAFASELGFEAYVDYCEDITTLVTYIQSGLPIVASVKTTETITNAPQAYPEGHLLVIRGFKKDDVSYVIVNDPASKTEEDVKRYYLLEEFLSIWRHVIYVIKPRGQEDA